MNIWLTHVGELLPIDGEVRLFRYGILADMLVERGHLVTRWAPTFIHAYKRQRADSDKTVWLSPNYRIELLYAGGYDRNISIQRARFHRELERVLERRMYQERLLPDIILAGIPTPGMCLAATRYAQHYHIPVVVDVRDLWPDIYLTILPRPLRSIARLALWPAYRTNQILFQKATAIWGVSESYLNWGLQFAGRRKAEFDAIFPLGYPKPNFSPQMIEEKRSKLIDFGVAPEKTICCFFGQFEASYDLETVIEAARVFEQTGETRIQFVLCGNGSKLESLRQRAAGLSNVVFPGWVSAVTIHALMKMSAIGLAAYSSTAMQSLPNKPIEYMAGGLPVLSSLRGELEQILTYEHCGLTYKAGNVEDFVRSVRFLIDYPDERERMGENAHRTFNERFSAEGVYSSMVDHLEEIAIRNPRWSKRDTKRRGL